MQKYWLFKSEPDVFSIQDLAASKGRKTTWEGVRNYQARNLIRDEIQRGDGVFFYHSNADPMAIVGIAEVAKAGYPDYFAQKEDHKYFDESATPETPIWYMVDIRLVRIFSKPVTRAMLATNSVTSKMMVMKKGSRLSIQPVSAAEWVAVQELADETDFSNERN